MKSDVEVFLHYAAAFEEAYKSDRWETVRQCFADDAVYEVEGTSPFSGTWKGADAIVDHLIESVNAFDRTFDERALELVEGPEMKDGAVRIRWAGVYRRKGREDLRSEGEELAWIKDGKVVRLKDSM